VWRAALLAPLVVAVPWLTVTVGSGLPPQLTAVTGAVLALLVVVTTTTDLRSRRIPNWATYTAALWGLGLPLAAAVVPDSWTIVVPGVFGATEVPLGTLLAGVEIRHAVAGFAVGFGVMFLLYGVFQGGAGDVKLVTAAGALVGIDNLFQVLVYGYVIAAVCAACWLVLTGGPGGLAREVGKGLGAAKPVEPATPLMQKRIPMAPFLNAGVVLALFWRGV
jgi:Flp pilus assembly protein protease CpaA